MPTVNCRSLWTGEGSCLSNVSVDIDDSGIIQSIRDSSRESFENFDHCFAMPSFVDAHIHYSWMVVKEASLDLSEVRSADECLSVVQTAVNRRDHDIVRGESFDESEWIDEELPSLARLDSITGDVPVFLRRVCGHTAIVNSSMLRLIDPDQAGVDRSTGVLKEWPVLNFEVMFPLPEKVLTEAMSRVDSMIFSKGVTAARTFESTHTAELVQNSSLAPDLSISIMVDDIEKLLKSGFPATKVKIFLDGSLGARNAAILCPYPDSSVGELSYTDDELLALLLRCGEAGFSISVHAIGGKALQQLDLVSNSAFRILGHGFNVSVEHAEDILKAWPGTWNSSFHVFSMQPNFVERWQRPGGMYDRILSGGQSMLLNPFRTILESGFQLGFGSDCMPLDPLYGLRGAIHHRTGKESLSIEEAFSAYTLNAASIAGLGHLAVPLGRGRTADMVFLSGNPFEEFVGVTVEATMKNGRYVFRKNPLSKGI